MIDLLKKFRENREKSLRKDYEQRAKDDICFCDKDGRLVLSFKGVAIFYVKNSGEYVTHENVDYVSIEDALKLCDKLRKEYVEVKLMERL